MTTRTIEVQITGDAQPLLRELRRAELEMRRAGLIRGRRYALRAAFRLGREFERLTRQEGLS